MPDCAAFTDGQRKSRVGMHHRIFLNVTARADRDPLIIATQDRSKPDRSALLYPHVSNQNRFIRNPVFALGQNRSHPVQFINHCIASYSAFSPLTNPVSPVTRARFKRSA